MSLLNVYVRVCVCGYIYIYILDTRPLTLDNAHEEIRMKLHRKCVISANEET